MGVPYIHCGYLLFLLNCILLRAKRLGSYSKQQILLKLYELLTDVLLLLGQGMNIQGNIQAFAEPQIALDNGGTLDQMVLNYKKALKLHEMRSDSDEYARILAMTKNRLHMISDDLPEHEIPKTTLFCIGATPIKRH